MKGRKREGKKEDRVRKEGKRRRKAIKMVD